MNETLKTIINRRSIRKFKAEQIKDEELSAILEAGKFAPSGMNQQPWHFSVIQNKKMLQKINQACKACLIKTGNKRFEELSKDTKAEDISLTFNAPTLIIVSGDRNAIASQTDCTMAIENMFIAAESLGIGTCWIHAITLLYSDPEGEALLMNEGIIPKDYILAGSAVFGYKATKQPSAAPRKENTVTFYR